MTEEHPEDWSPAVDMDAIEIALDTLEDEADDHGGEFAAGIRYAEQMLGEMLLVDEPTED